MMPRRAQFFELREFESKWQTLSARFPSANFYLFIGSVIGSGIFLTPGLILRRVHDSVSKQNPP